jgi:HK97 family phage major capsid protein
MSVPAVRVGSSLTDHDPRRGFESPREFLGAIIDATLSGRPDARLKPLAVAGSDEQGVYSDPAGGFLVPAGFASFELRRTVTDPMASRTTPIPMSVADVSIPARVDSNHTSSVTGGVTVVRNPETVTVPDSRLKFSSVGLHASTLAGLTFSTDRLVNDSRPTISAVLDRAFRDAVAAKMIRERIDGSGAGEPLGVLRSPARILVAKETGQASDSIVFENIEKMALRCYGYDQATWHANHDTRQQLTRVVQVIGTAGVPRYQCSTRDDEPDRLYGRPIFYSEFSPALGDEGDLILVNWGEYLDGTLQPLQSLESIHVRFMAAETAFRFWLRGDGKPWWLDVLTPERGANTLSPYVILAARP